MSNTNDSILQNPASNLPEELIIINILPKLPIKSLLRFKIVSKKWNSSISSPYFAKLHFNQSSNNKNQHFLINHKTCFLSFDCESFEQNHENGDQKTWDCSPFDEEGDIISTNKNCVARVLKSDFHLPNSNIFAIGSCNGLVCLHNAKSSNSLYLWNPTILALREIPYPESNPNPKRNNSSCLDAVWGFGYVSSTDDYKIVRLYQNKSNNVIEIQIFSTINNNWKSLQETCEDNWSFFGLKNRIGTYADNAIYWAYSMKVLNQSRQNYDYKEWCIIGFDLVAEKLMKVPLPESASTGFEYPPLMYATMDGYLGACWNIAYNVREIGMFIKDEGIGKWKNVNGSGHGGSRAAEYLKQFLFENLMKHPKFMEDTKAAISETYKQTDKAFLDAEKDTFRDDGSTASTAVLVDNHLYVANVGDSRTVLSRAGKAIPLSDDHKPNRVDERKRIESAGGVVMWAGTWRVGGVLAMSRAFGNRMLKQFVVAEPEIQEQEINEELEVLVLASDGLWDVIPNEDAVSLARAEEDPETAARNLTETAFTRGSADNITCIVVKFHHDKVVEPQLEQKKEPAPEYDQTKVQSLEEQSSNLSELQQDQSNVLKDDKMEEIDVLKNPSEEANTEEDLVKETDVQQEQNKEAQECDTEVPLCHSSGGGSSASA